MSKKIIISANPYDEDFVIFKNTEPEFIEGITILVGANGTGKTTMIRNIRECMEKEKIPCMVFNNLIDGGTHNVEYYSFTENLPMLASSMSASEGENIIIAIGRMIEKLRKFIITGDNGNRLQKFPDNITKERWLLLDAAGSGLSIDNIISLKNVLQNAIADAKSHDIILYIIIAGNEYEMAREEKCMDVVNGKYIEFSDYEKYREFILNSKEEKLKR